MAEKTKGKKDKRQKEQKAAKFSLVLFRVICNILQANFASTVIPQTVTEVEMPAAEQPEGREDNTVWKLSRELGTIGQYRHSTVWSLPV